MCVCVFVQFFLYSLYVRFVVCRLQWRLAAKLCVCVCVCICDLRLSFVLLARCDDAQCSPAATTINKHHQCDVMRLLGILQLCRLPRERRQRSDATTRKSPPPPLPPPPPPPPPMSSITNLVLMNFNLHTISSQLYHHYHTTTIHWWWTGRDLLTLPPFSLTFTCKCLSTLFSTLWFCFVFCFIF